MSEHAPKIIEKYAATDAMLDGTGTQFQAFFARLKQLAGSVTKDGVTSTLSEFHQWSKSTGQEFEEMAGNLPSDLDISVDALETRTQGNLAQAQNQYAEKITQLANEKRCWERRFGPSLPVSIAQRPQKNGWWVVGVAILAVAIETLINMQFFAAGSKFGLLGGAQIALGVSVVNVIFPMVLAFAGHLGFYQHKHVYRALGILAIAAVVLWAFGFNYEVAEYRKDLQVAGSEFSTLSYVVLFTVGVSVVCGSFWKMWDYLDPFKNARKCMEDLHTAQDGFKKDVCADLHAAQTKYTDMSSSIKRLALEIPGRLLQSEAEYVRVHNKVIENAKQVFTRYHGVYSAKKVDPDPDRPVVTLENAETEYGVGITTAEREYFATMKAHLTKYIEDAQKEWSKQLRELLLEINKLLKRFGDVIIAMLQEWGAQEQPVQAPPA